MATSESLMFDGNRMQEEQEEQLKQEEDERQQQLKDLLANAFDDLNDDDSVSSNDSQDSGRHSGETVGPQQRWSATQAQGEKPSEWFASTPMAHSKAPALVTPMIQRRYTSPAAPYSMKRALPEYLDESQDSLNEATLNQEPIPDDDMGVSPSQYEQNHKLPVNDLDTTAYLQHPYEKTRHQTGVDETDSAASHPFSYEPAQRLYSQTEQLSPHVNTVQYQLQHTAIREETEISGCSQDSQTRNVHTEHYRNTSDTNHKNSTDTLQDRFFREGSNTSGQLEILYQARGKQLQELKERYELLQLDSSKELRMLRHEIALLQGGKQGCEASLKQTQTLLTQNKDARFELHRKLDSLSEENGELKSERKELEDQLKAAEASIESLNAQVFALGNSDSMQRTREQYEAIIRSLEQAHESATERSREEIQDLQDKLNDKELELEKYRLEFLDQQKTHQQEKMSHAESVNRLTKSLYESQQQTQEMLEKSSSEEMSKIKIQLQQALASKSLTEQLNDNLQRQLKDMKEQLFLYESASQVNVFVNGQCTPEPCDDTLLELGVKKKSDKSSAGKHTESKTKDGDTTLILRRELQKCLALIKDKRIQLQTLETDVHKAREDCLLAQSEASALKAKISLLEKQVQETSIELNLYKSAASEGSSLAEVKLKTQTCQLAKDKEILLADVQALTDQLTQTTESEARLEELNSELQHQMAEMIQDFDRDKQAALDRCQRTLEEHGETVKEMMKTELHEEFNRRLSHMEQSYQAQIDKLRINYDSASEELCRVKEQYLQVCEEKSRLEESENQDMESSHKQLDSLQSMVAEVDALKAAWAEQEQAYLQEKATLHTDYTTLLSEHTDLKKLYTSLQIVHKEFELLQGQHVKALQRADDDIADLKRQLDVCQKSCGDSEDLKRLADSQAECQTLKECLNALEMELKTEKTTSSQRLSKLEEERLASTLAKQRFDDLETQLNYEQKEHSSVKCDLQRLESESQKEKVEYLKKIEDLEKRFSQEINELNLVRQNKSDLQVQLSELRLDKIISTESIKTLQSTLADLKTELKLCQDELTMEQASHALTKKNQVDQQNGRIKFGEGLELVGKLQQELELVKSNHQQAQTRIDELNNELIEERRVHNQAKYEVIKLQGDVNREKDEHAYMMSELQKVLESSARQNKEFELTKANQKRDTELLQEYKNRYNEEKEKLEQLQMSQNLVKTELNEAKADIIRKVSEISQLRSGQSRLQSEIDRLSSSSEAEKLKLISEHDESLKKALVEARENWAQTVGLEQVNETKQLKETVNSLQTQVQKYEHLLSQADTHFEEQIEHLTKQIEAEQRDRLKTSIDSVNDSVSIAQKCLNEEREKHDKEKQVLEQRVSLLSEEVDTLKKRCTEYKLCIEQLQLEVRVLTNQSSELKLTNKKMHSDLKKVNQTHKTQLEVLAQKLTSKDKEICSSEHEHTVTIQSLKQRMIEMRNEHSNELEVIRRNSIEEVVRRKYELSLQQMKAAVMEHVDQTNRDAAKLIRSEIHKTKQSTARQMRNYYVKCFKRSIKDVQMTAEEKVDHMEKTLESAVDEIILPAGMTLNVDSILTIPDNLLTDNELTIRPGSQTSCYKDGARTKQSRSSSNQLGVESRSVPTSEGSRRRFIPLRERGVSPSVHSNGLGRTHSLDALSSLPHMQTSSLPRQYNPPPEKLNSSPKQHSQQMHKH